MTDGWIRGSWIQILEPGNTNVQVDNDDLVPAEMNRYTKVSQKRVPLLS